MLHRDLTLSLHRVLPEPRYSQANIGIVRFRSSDFMLYSNVPRCVPFLANYSDGEELPLVSTLLRDVDGRPVRIPFTRIVRLGPIR